MGSAVLEGAHNHAACTVVSAVDRDGHTAPANAGRVTSDIKSAIAVADVVVDFSLPDLATQIAEQAAILKKPLVTGTTGLSAAQFQVLDTLAKTAPVLWAANFSLGVAVLVSLAETAAAALGEEYDLEVLELHHRRKLDAPSGTALSLGEALAKGRGLKKSALVHGRGNVTAPRPRNEVGISALRGGDIIGEHTAFLIGEEERLELTHKAQSRSVFASGAIACARWLVGQPPGRYQVRDALGL